MVASKRVHDIAKEQGLTSRELLVSLEEAGVEGKLPLSSIDEKVALDALARSHGANGRSKGSGGTGAAEAAPKNVSLFGPPVVQGSGSGPGAPKPTLPPDRFRRPPGPNRRPAHRAPPARVGTGRVNPPIRRRTQRRAIVAVSVVAVLMLPAAWVLGQVATNDGEGQASKSRAGRSAAGQRAGAPVTGFRNTVASANGPSVAVYRSPGSPRPFKRLSNPNADGAPLVFLVRSFQDRWLQVYVPARPNGTVGWIKANGVSLSGHDFSVVVNLRRRLLVAREGDRVIASEPIGVGTAVTPTPAGNYYITELLKQPEADGSYGPYAFGLSAYSNVYDEFAGADGILGIHGTNEPDTVGADVSHGCIRVHNDVITRLARTLPPGTPVKITRDPQRI